MRAPARHGLALLALGAAAFALGAGAASAQAAPDDPSRVYFASQEIEGSGKYPSPGGFEGPCGLAIGAGGGLLVSDYYREEVDFFSSGLDFSAQLQTAVPPEPPNGPCGLAVGPGGELYVNHYHGGVYRFTPQLPPSPSPYGGGTMIDAGSATGVAVDPESGYVYVDDRTSVAVYEASGAPVLDEGAPMRIGVGSIGDGYGVALAGEAPHVQVYVADAADDRVEIYEPEVDLDEPKAVIDGHETPAGGFASLRDSTLAFDRTRARLYVVDDRGSGFDERPEAAILAFVGIEYAKRLKYNIVTARPAGLTSDAQGNVYVTSGNGTHAAVCIYGPDALTTAARAASENSECGERSAGSSALALAAGTVPTQAAAVADEALGARAGTPHRAGAAAKKRGRAKHRHRHRDGGGKAKRR